MVICFLLCVDVPRNIYIDCTLHKNEIYEQKIQIHNNLFLFFTLFKYSLNIATLMLGSMSYVSDIDPNLTLINRKNAFIKFLGRLFQWDV